MMNRGKARGGAPTGRGNGESAAATSRGFEDSEVKAFAQRNHDDGEKNAYYQEVDGRDTLSNFCDVRQEQTYACGTPKAAPRPTAEVVRAMIDAVKSRGRE
jgi:hypothetical protein